MLEAVDAKPVAPQPPSGAAVVSPLVGKKVLQLRPGLSAVPLLHPTEDNLPFAASLQIYSHSSAAAPASTSNRQHASNLVELHYVISGKGASWAVSDIHPVSQLQNYVPGWQLLRHKLLPVCAVLTPPLVGLCQLISALLVAQSAVTSLRVVYASSQIHSHLPWVPTEGSITAHAYVHGMHQPCSLMLVCMEQHCMSACMTTVMHWQRSVDACAVGID